MYNFLLWKESKIFIRLKKDKNLIYDKKNNKQIINILNFFKMEKNNVKEEQQFTAPVENAAVEQQVEKKKPWRKTRWGKALIAVVAIVLGVGGYVMFKKLKGSTTTETATDNAVEVEEQQKETPRENNNNRRDRFESRRQQWNNQQ